ncbi:histidinol dehydrogenase [Candidatus Gottesmanbacteria bacterium RIFCSPHIGHO2_02_FULL_39_14]|uniref:Histidinol dehydrogenase n=1 Tax=Candidatus Gottesmanbacteria bacterium RIFCSPHIGHO2_02_FULL_39_14 TaxID=1798383 RepID=A0A1F6A2B0_9BACT|nr:MAG: histidinol dehydrogenase [Candidatus Gottesmanbacteria bacterium RIFCSPHIGHO2_02_FULL_39_14]
MKKVIKEENISLIIQLYELKTMNMKDRQKIIQRSRSDINKVKRRVLPIIEDVRSRGDRAILDYLEKFDGMKLKQEELRISNTEIEEAYAKTDPLVLKMIRQQIELSQKFHREQFQRMELQWEIETIPGVKLGQKRTPIESTGLYVPGGTAPYPTVMQILAVPAKLAGVKRIIGVTPPRGKNYEVIVAANEAGVDEIYRIGGVAAVAALAYGTETIKPVDKIVGPGNIYVTASKMLVFGDVGIDMPAGPSEAIILADEGANPAYCAADILARAEHDPNAAGVLVTWSKVVAEKTKEEIIRQLPTLSRSVIIKQSLARYSAIIITSDETEAVEFTNEYAPEHLEVLTKNPYKLLPKFTNAGSIFLGYNTPVPVGDYASGTNHVLPTGGWAKMFSPVGVETFMKVSEFQSVTKEGLESLAPIIDVISEVEGLDAHWNTIEQRLQKGTRLWKKQS